MTRGELVVVIFFVLATAFVSGFLAVALKYPELLPWYGNPSTDPPRPLPPFGKNWWLKTGAATHAEAPARSTNPSSFAFRRISCSSLQRNQGWHVSHPTRLEVERSRRHQPL